jgi:hypothetical protein
LSFSMIYDHNQVTAVDVLFPPGSAAPAGQEGAAPEANPEQTNPEQPVPEPPAPEPPPEQPVPEPPPEPPSPEQGTNTQDGTARGSDLFASAAITMSPEDYQRLHRDLKVAVAVQ